MSEGKQQSELEKTAKKTSYAQFVMREEHLERKTLRLSSKSKVMEFHVRKINKQTAGSRF